MHNYIPCNPFKATVKIPSSTSRPVGGSESNKSSSSPDTRGENRRTDRMVLSEGQAEAYKILDKYSPASFPSTPFSRAHVMHRTEEKTDTVMFAARDILRMEVQSSSRDDYSHRAAEAFLNTGQMAIFDPRQSSEGIVLSCGNHCAHKLGRALCSSSRVMVPVPTNRFVYMEFSIEASISVVPSIALGLSPPDCPLNVSVGSWAKSVGLFSDSGLTVASRLFERSQASQKISAGNTVGILVYIPSEIIPSAVAVNDDPNTSGPNVFPTAMGNVVRAIAPNRMEHLSKLPDPTCLNGEGKEEKGEKDSGGNQQKILPMIVQFSIDGVPVHFSPEARSSVQKTAFMSTPLYPTVSIMSEGTKVWCRMSEADQIYRSSSCIGAPSNVKVYCLDGSLLIQPNTNISDVI
jgi:hypothetical protein